MNCDYDIRNLEECYNAVLNHDINLTEEDIFEFLKITYRWPFRYPWNQATVEVITEYGLNSSEYFFNQHGRFQYDEWKKFYDEGFTTILSNVLDLSPELRSLSDKLFKFSGTRINGNFYFSKGSRNHRVSFPQHNHEYPVIVKPIYGNCKWILGNEELQNPTKSFIIPPRTIHGVVEGFDKRLSLTLNID
tara:strand:- start:61 stop:630 length:570 start_codon:yes stop_codon:yes gene_type:complete